MFKTIIFDGFQYTDYDILSQKVNDFCKENDVVRVSNGVEKGRPVYSIVYRTSKTDGLTKGPTNFSEFYHNNVALATASCGCSIVLSRSPRFEYIGIDNFPWVKFCKEHGVIARA